MTEPLIVLRRFAEGQVNETRVWPLGATLADAGYQLVEQKEKPMTANPVQTVENIAKRRGLSFDEALKTPEGSRAYSEHRTALFASQAAPRPAPPSTAPSRFDEVRGATSQRAVDALRDFEEQVAADARARCKERSVVADAAGIARMTAELVAEDNTLYDRYSRLQRAVAAGG